MADRATRMRLKVIKGRLEAMQYLFGNEAKLHDLIGRVLSGAELDYVHEHKLDAKSRADFWLDGIVIEVKVDGDMASAARQCERYLKIPEVQGVVLASTCQWARNLDPRVLPSFKNRLAIAHLRRSAL